MTIIKCASRYCNIFLFKTVSSASKHVVVDSIVWGLWLFLSAIYIRRRCLILARRETASVASSEVLMRQSRRRTAISREVAINRAVACHEVTWQGRARHWKKDCGREETRGYGENVEIVDKSHNQSDPISGHVRDIRLRSGRPAKNNWRRTALL